MIAFASLILSVPLLLLRAWAIMLLWRWFIAPLGVDALSLAHAVGLSAFGSLFMYVPKPPKDEDELERLIFNICVGVIVPLIAVAVGVVAK